MSEKEKVVETKKKGLSLSLQDHDYINASMDERLKQSYTNVEWSVLTIIRKVREKQEDSVLDLESEKESINRNLSAISLVLENIILKAQDSVQEARDLDKLELSEIKSELKLKESRIEELVKMIELLQQTNDDKDKMIELL